MSDAQCSGAPGATSAVKHNVVVSFRGSLHFKPLLKELRGQLQRLLQVVHWHAYQQRPHMLTTNAGKQENRQIPTSFRILLTRDVDGLGNLSSLVLIRISHIKELNVMACQHGLQLWVGHHWTWKATKKGNRKKVFILLLIVLIFVENYVKPPFPDLIRVRVIWTPADGKHCGCLVWGWNQSATAKLQYYQIFEILRETACVHHLQSIHLWKCWV